MENYLRQRVEPLLKSGIVHAVNWNKEPLPHEVNFVVRSQWTPSNTLKKQKTQQNSPSKLGTSASTSAAITNNYENLERTVKRRKDSRFNSSSSSSDGSGYSDHQGESPSWNNDNRSDQKNYRRSPSPLSNNKNDQVFFYK